MNLNFHHRHYVKCSKCHKIHTNNHRGISTKSSTEKTSKGFLDTLNNHDDIRKDIEADTEGHTKTELDDQRYAYEVRPVTMNKHEIEETNQKASMNCCQDASYRYRSINSNVDTNFHALEDIDIKNPLEKLKELQKQRATSDNFYSQEIQKIIGKYFMTTYNTTKNHRSRNVEGDRCTKTAPTEELEQCGAITTIIRLDCGCVQRTRRPLYTPSTADTRRIHYYHCADGEIDGEADTINTSSPFSSPTRYQDETTSFDCFTRKPRVELGAETSMHHPMPNIDENSAGHSTLKSGNSKSLRDTFYRRSTS